MLRFITRKQRRNGASKKRQPSRQWTLWMKKHDSTPDVFHPNIFFLFSCQRRAGVLQITSTSESLPKLLTRGPNIMTQFHTHTQNKKKRNGMVASKKQEPALIVSGSHHTLRESRLTPVITVGEDQRSKKVCRGSLQGCQ